MDCPIASRCTSSTNPHNLYLERPFLCASSLWYLQSRAKREVQEDTMKTTELSALAEYLLCRGEFIKVLWPQYKAQKG